MIADAPVRESTSPSLAAPEFELRRLSVVVPVLDEVDSLPQLHDELTNAVSRIGVPVEIIYVDDGSRDGSSELLHALFERDPSVQVVQFRRNFGKSAALSAGFHVATGDAIVTLDADLQDTADEIPRLIERLEADVDLVSGWKHPRHDPLSKRLPSTLFNSVVRALTGVPLHDFNCGFKVYRAQVVKELPLYGELHRYIPVLAHNRGFRVDEVKVHHRPRLHGKTKYGGARFARGFFDLLTVLFLTQYTRRPLHLFGWFGITTLLLGFLINAYLATLWFLGQPIGHRPLLSLGLLLMIIGAQFFVFGLLAEMIASTTTVKPEYSVRRHMRRNVPADDAGH